MTQQDVLQTSGESTVNDQGAFAAIWDPQSGILLPKREALYPERYRGVREFPGGRLEEDEEYLVGLQREVLEELGINIFTPQFTILSAVQIFIPKEHNPHWVRLVLIQSGYIDLSTLTYPDGEASDAQWIPLHKISDQSLTEFQRSLFLPALSHMIDPPL